MQAQVANGVMDSAAQLAQSQALGFGAEPAPDLQWRSAIDIQQLRASIVREIYQLFVKKQPAQTQNERFPVFCQRLEQELFNNARSKEEYLDLSTLEQRLQLVARNMTNNKTSVPAPTPAAAPVANGSVQQGLVQQAQANSLQTFSQVPTGPTLLPTAQLAAAPAAGMPAANGISMLPNGAITPGADTSNVAALQQQVANPSPATNGMVPTDAGAQSLLQAQLQQSIAQVSQAPVSSAPAAAPQQVMSNGVPVIRGTRAQGQQQAGQIPSTPQIAINGINPAAAASVAQLPVPTLPGFIPTGPTNTMIPTSPMIPVASNGLQPGGMVPIQQQQTSQPAAANGPVGSGMVPVPGGMVPVSNVAGANLSGVDAGLGNSMPGLGGAQQQQQQQQQRPAEPGQQEKDRQNQERQLYIQKQQRWLLFLRHCAKCQMSEADCQFGRSCRVGKELWQHILSCNEATCEFPRCHSSKDLLKHHQKCQNPQCPICTPVKEYVKRIRTQNGGSGATPSAMNAQQMGQLGGWDKSAQLAGQKRLASGMLVGAGGLAASPMGMVPTNSMGMVTPMGEPKRIKTEGDPELLKKNTGTSLLETFTDHQILHHVDHIRQLQAQTRQAQEMLPTYNANDACTVCGCIKLLFEPPLLYCMGCGGKIKRAQVFYCTSADTEVQGQWCHSCFSNAQGDVIVVEGALKVRKAELHKKKNDEELEESWVQCDYCEGWVHQICGLFNRGRNDSSVHYLCPECLVKSSGLGVRSRITERPQAMLTARELPQCELSKALELRLNNALRLERGSRAMRSGTPLNQVTTAEGLTVRVINNVEKFCEVKPKFYETFQAEGVAKGFPYKQKVVLLFQHLDGVDVCLYCMYVQEYGADCPAPNTNAVYLSYIDSVKYFRPEVTIVHPVTQTSMALRTYVYQQILLGYLDYVKRLGFQHLYIWACPPSQGDDYILYCHPARQKVPRSDRLRAWYLEMLRQAKDEGIVVHLSTLFDTYFEGGRDHRVERCSAVNVPYLEGDYWPGEAENLLTNIQEGGRMDAAKGNKGMGRKASSKGKRYGSGPATTDEQLMSRLGEVLGGNMREDFIVAHLHEPCCMCRAHVPDPGAPIYRYIPTGPSKPLRERQFDGIKLEPSSAAPVGQNSFFQICQRCYSEEAGRCASGCRSRLPAGLSLSDLQMDAVKGMAALPDPDGRIDCEFFETRQQFLSLCQGNHYQFDTLRRAKHSSMMVLYHLHNPHAPAFSSTCNRCKREIEPGNGLRCTQCQDFDMCLACKQAGHSHEHQLVLQTANMDETQRRFTETERQERMQTMQRTMALLVHACACKAPDCKTPSCSKVKLLFNHALSCTKRINGGCPLCRKMWILLNQHAKSCTRPDCHVPRCRELQELRRRQAQRMEAKRRSAYQQMLRNQANAQD